MKKLTGIEVIGLFNINNSDLKQMRDEGLTCDLIGGQYYYNYNDIVEFLK